MDENALRLVCIQCPGRVVFSCKEGRQRPQYGLPSRLNCSASSHASSISQSLSINPQQRWSHTALCWSASCTESNAANPEAMRRVFGVKKEKAPAPTVEEATQRINKRGDTIDQKIKKLDGELFRYREQIKKTRPGPAQDAIKARAMRILKQKKLYENQRDQLYSQTFNLEQVAFATEGLKDAQETMSAMKAANKDLKGTMKTLKMDDIDKMQDEMMDLVDYSSEIQETLGRSYGVPDDLDEEELMGELDALEADMGLEIEEGMPSYLQDDKEEPEMESDINLPAAPSGHAAQPQVADEYGFPTVPRTSIRT